MWKLLAILVTIGIVVYYITLILHLIGVIRIGHKLGVSAKWFLPFVLWFGKS